MFSQLGAVRLEKGFQRRLRDSFDGTMEHGMEPATYYECPVLDEINALGDFKESKTYKEI